MSINSSLELARPVQKLEREFSGHHFLILPGFQNSGPGHWQTIWEQIYPQHFSRVEQNDWEDPRPDQWIERIDEYVARATRPLVLVGHSLGSNAAVQWSLQSQWLDKVNGMLLVAPADTDHSLIPAVQQFGSVPLEKLPVPAIVVASINDPHAVISRQAAFAAYWGAKFKTVGSRGHINAKSGLDTWDEGLEFLRELTNA